MQLRRIAFAAIAFAVVRMAAMTMAAEPAAGASDPDRDDLLGALSARGEPPEVARLLGRMRDAAGPRPNAERVVETVERDGATTVVTRVRLGADERETLVAGELTTARGIYRGQRWLQNANGLTVLDRPPIESSIARDPVTASLALVTEPLAADVVTVVRGDRRERLFVDPATARVVRRERTGAGRTEITTYGDFRTVDGSTLAWVSRTTDGRPADDSVTRIVSVATRGIADDAVAILAPRRALVAFPRGNPRVPLPIRYDSQLHFLVRVGIAGRGYDFIVDSGAPGIVLDEGTAVALGAKLLAAPAPPDVADGAELQAIVPEMHVGALTMRDVVVSVIPAFSFDDRNVDARAVGLLGFDFIASVALRLRYDRPAVDAIDYDAFVPPSGPNVTTLPIRVGRLVPETAVAIDGRSSRSFIVDTAGAGALTIADAFVRRDPKLVAGFVRRDRTIALGGALGGEIAPLYTVPSLRIGPIDFQNFTATVVPAGDDALQAFDGIVGPAVLQYYDVTTDYADSTIYLEPNGRSNVHRSF